VISSGRLADKVVQKESHVLMVITRKTDLNIFLRYIKTLDPDAFLSVCSVSGVYGKGFDMIKGSSKGVHFGEINHPTDKEESVKEIL